MFCSTCSMFSMSCVVLYCLCFVLFILSMFYNVLYFLCFVFYIFNVLCCSRFYIFMFCIVIYFLCFVLFYIFYVLCCLPGIFSKDFPSRILRPQQVVSSCVETEKCRLRPYGSTDINRNDRRRTFGYVHPVKSQISLRIRTI